MSYTACHTCTHPTTNHCPRCRTTPYCSHECEVADWCLHRDICGKADTPPVWEGDVLTVEGLERRFERIGGQQRWEGEGEGDEEEEEEEAEEGGLDIQSRGRSPTPQRVGERSSRGAGRGYKQPKKALHPAPSSASKLRHRAHTPELACSPPRPAPSPAPPHDPYWETSNPHTLTIDTFALPPPRTRPTTHPARARTPSPDLLDISDTKLWLSTLPQQALFEALIDAYRLRVHDEYSLTGVAPAGSVYSGVDVPLGHFCAFLESARREGVLPDTWTRECVVGCVEVAADKGGGAWVGERVGVEEVWGKYGSSDRIVVDVLRIVAGRVWGRLWVERVRFFEGAEGEVGWWG